MGSFQLFGLASDLKQPEISNDSRPVLIHSIDRSTSSNKASERLKLLQVEFEVNPVNKDSGYRVKVVSQSIEIKYNAVSILVFQIICDHRSYFSRRLINLWNVLNKTLDVIFKGKFYLCK